MCTRSESELILAPDDLAPLHGGVDVLPRTFILARLGRAAVRALCLAQPGISHGFTAAVAMCQYHSLLRTIATSGAPVEQILQEADHRLASLGLDRLATCLLALIAPGTGTCTLASAGHPPTLLLHPDTTTALLAVPTGPPLGTDLGGYEATTVPLPPEAVLLMYTDGLIEHRTTDIDDSLVDWPASASTPTAPWRTPSTRSSPGCCTTGPRTTSPCPPPAYEPPDPYDQDQDCSVTAVCGAE
ncbi:PP2C family protein-serine/threonine phosphatase [Streptomyces griseoviridis]